MSSSLVSLIRLIHIGLIIFVLFAWLIPWNFLRWTHLFFVPLLCIHWKTNGECILTQWERRLKGQKDRVEAEFTKSLLAIIGVELSRTQLLYFIYSLMLASWLGSLSFIIVTQL